MTGFFDLLMEGDSGDDEEIKVDEKVEKEIEESCLPMTTLIEATFTDVETSVNTAIETYEMACIIGGTKVVAEGLDQEGASEILTETVGSFFESIGNAIKKARDAVVGLIQKLILNAQAIGKDIKAKYGKIESNFNKNYKSGAKYKGFIIDKNVMEKCSAAVNEVAADSNINKSFNVGTVVTENANPVKDIVTAFISKSGISSKAETIKDVATDVKKAFGIDGDAKEISVGSNELGTMKAVVQSCTKAEFKREKQAMKDANKVANECLKELKKGAKQADTAKEKISIMTKTFSTWTNLASTITNLKLKTQYSAGRSYLHWMQKIAKGKGGTAAADDGAATDTDTGDDPKPYDDDSGTGYYDTGAQESFIPGMTIEEVFEYAELSDILEASDVDDDENGVEESYDGGFPELGDGSIYSIAEQLLI